MKRTIGMHRRKGAQLFGLAAAVFLWGCLNPIQFRIEDESFGEAPSTDGRSADERSAAGIGGEEFTITLRVGEGGPRGRAVVGPDTGGIELGVIRNIAQVIAVDAETGDIADFQQEARKKAGDTGIPLQLHNLWVGKRYHFLILMGHRERTYGETAGDNIIYKDLPPTLLAAGFLADQLISADETTITITMKPLVVDTAFTYGGVTAPAVLGGTELPAGVGASLVWTLAGGGLGTLVDAQNRAGITSGWGEVSFTAKTTILHLSTGGGGTKLAVLGGTDHNQIVLDLGERDAGVTGSANFNLEYIPFGFGDMDAFTGFDTAAASWILRNGVNDEAQDGDTTFSGSPIPWDGTVNGNGAAVFTAAQGSVDLTGYIPAPVVGGAPQTSFYTSQYIGKVKWIPNHSVFQAGVAYQATITLEPAAGFVFSSDLQASHGGAGSAAVTHEYDLSAYIPVPIRNAALQKQDDTAIKWVDYSTDKWTIHAYWRERDASPSYSSYPDDAYWRGEPGSFTGDSYGALIILQAKPGYSFDEGVDFKYPTYADDTITGPVRGYYQFDYYLQGIDWFGKTWVYWLWQDAATPRSPPPKYDTAPFELYHNNGTTNTNNYPMSIRGSSKAGDYTTANKHLKYKPRTEERFVMVGFNTQNTVPVPVSPPSGGPAGGVRLVKLGFKTLPIPSNLDSGGATFSEAVTMIRAAQQAGAGYLSLKLNGLTKAGKGKDAPDTSVAAVSFSVADSPPAVVVDGGNRVVEGTDYNPPYITVGNGVTLTLRNITLKSVTNRSVVRVESGGVLILEEGAVITGHTTTHSEGGGGVYVAGSLIMKGGEISGNTAAGGGGVYVAANGAFTMQGGTIKNNNANSNGGAVYVDNGGTFFMQGGTVSGNTANGSGGGVHVSTGGTFVKAAGAIYGGNAANANTAAGSGSAVYVQGGRHRNDTVMDFLDSGKSINAGGWDYPVITHTYTAGRLEAGQVDWYVFAAPGGGAPSSVEYTGGPLKVSAYRSNAAPIFADAAAPPTFSIAAGVKVYVKVEGGTSAFTGDYEIRQGPLLLNSGTDLKANDGNITAGGAQVDWYVFTTGTAGVYQLWWEDITDHGGNYFTGDVKVSAYKYDETLLIDKEDAGKAQVPLGPLSAGETIYVKAEGITDGKYAIRYYAP